MRRIFLSFIVLLLASSAGAQSYVIQSTFQPLSMEELMIAAKAEAMEQERLQELFEQYKDQAYECYNRGDYAGFITYSNYALGTGWYNNKMYNDRGQVFERYHEYKAAKKEYKRAMKKGYYPAEYAYKQCKVNEKMWKKSH